MMQIIHNRRLSWTVRILLSLLGIAAIAAYAFMQGMFYANKKATIELANDTCFYAVHALRAVKDPGQQRVMQLFDRSLDSSALKLAEMCLKDPRYIQRSHYNLLVRVRDYRKQYGRDNQLNRNTDSVEVDKKIDEAIACLETIHKTNDWGSFKFDINKEKWIAQ
jgi:hypothetical protein